jgi:hypothetical protein
MYNHLNFGAAESGGSYLSIGNFDYQPLATLTQSFSDVVGAKYRVSYWAYDGGAKNDANAFLKVAVGAKGSMLNDSVGAPWHKFMFAFTGTGHDTLAISGQTNPSEWFVDNLSVCGPMSSAVPESSTWAMMLFGFAGLGFAARRRSGRGVARAPRPLQFA